MSDLAQALLIAGMFAFVCTVLLVDYLRQRDDRVERRAAEERAHLLATLDRAERLARLGKAANLTELAETDLAGAVREIVEGPTVEDSTADDDLPDPVTERVSKLEPDVSG